jgi:hypothetical protein
MTQGRPVCLPKFAAGLDKKGAEALATQLKALDPKLYGTCEAVCWLKQVGLLYNYRAHVFVVVRVCLVAILVPVDYQYGRAALLTGMAEQFGCLQRCFVSSKGA